MITIPCQDGMERWAIMLMMENCLAPKIQRRGGNLKVFFKKIDTSFISLEE